MRRFIILLFVFPLAAFADITGKVLVVLDGDSIKVLDSHNNQYEVRLKGIDAPEKGQPYANKSRAYLTAMLAGKMVFIESNRYDRYGRVVGKIWVQPADCPTCGKTLDVNHAQILAGMAWWNRYYAKQQSASDRRRYESAEYSARAQKRGLWADPNPVLPYQWRKWKRQ